MSRRLVIIVDVSDVPGANVDTPEVLAHNLLSADGEYTPPPHSAHWEHEPEDQP